MKDMRLSLRISAAIAGVATLLSACATNHYSEAILYQATDLSQSPTLYAASDIGNNPVYVSPDAKFKLEIEYLRPGWIHQGKFKTAPTPEASSWYRRQASHLYGKELWLLTKIESLSNNDVFERDSKVYYKVTNVKLNSASFLKVALDANETQIFSHAADSAYRVTMRLYEVDGFKLKRFLLNSYDSSPGLPGILDAGKATLLSTISGLAGTAVSEFLSTNSQDKSALERVLLKNNATIEMNATFNILRGTTNLPKAGEVKTTHFILYDKFKSEEWQYNFNDSASYKKQIEGVYRDKINIASLPTCEASTLPPTDLKECAPDKRSFIKMRLTELTQNNDEPNKGIKNSTGDTLLLQEQFNRSYKSD